MVECETLFTVRIRGLALIEDAGRGSADAAGSILSSVRPAQVSDSVPDGRNSDGIDDFFDNPFRPLKQIGG